MAQPPPRGGGSSDRRRGPDWNDLQLPLPRATAVKIERLGKRPSDSANLGLWLDKLVWREKGTLDLKAEKRAFSLAQFCRQYRSETAATAALRLVDAARSLHGPGQLQVFRATIDGRLLVGYGRASAIETSLTFHQTCGAPMIPGSALKGITRARAAIDPLLEGSASTLAFGDLKQAGDLVFYDALPELGSFEIGLDVLTPHVREYYEGREPPADWLSPSPHTFLTVVKTSFVFIVGHLPSKEDGTKERLQAGVQLLKNALEEDGVGAKTVAGYGRFRDFINL